MKIEISEPFQVGAIIAKLPPSWKGYVKKIMHNSKDFSMEHIKKHLLIEVELKVREGAKNSNICSSQTNAVSKPNKSKNKVLGPKKDQEKFKRRKKKVQRRLLNVWQVWPLCSSV